MDKVREIKSGLRDWINAAVYRRYKLVVDEQSSVDPNFGVGVGFWDG